LRSLGLVLQRDQGFTLFSPFFFRGYNDCRLRKSYSTSITMCGKVWISPSVPYKAWAGSISNAWDWSLYGIIPPRPVILHDVSRQERKHYLHKPLRKYRRNAVS